MKARLIFAAAILGLASLTSTVAGAVTVTVEAITPVASWLDTGVNLNSATTYNLTVINPSTLWSAGAPPGRDSTADGIDPNGVGHYGQYTLDGYTFNYGALVGEIGSYFFLIGAGPTNVSGLSGELHVGYWESYYSDNSGFQTLSITATPLPSTWTMLIAGFAGFGFLAYRGTKKKGIAALAVA